MLGRPYMRTLSLRSPDAVWLRLAALGCLFCTGAVAGFVCARLWADTGSEFLGEYLTGFCRLYDTGSVDSGLWSVAGHYFCWIVMLFLSGFSAAGAVTVPLLSGVFGFLSMYAVSCFCCVFCRPGVLVALAALGPRLLFTLPTFFYLAEAAWPQAAALAAVSIGKGKRSAPVLFSGGYFLRFFVCVVILTVGVCCERLLVPVLIRAAVDAVL